MHCPFYPNEPTGIEAEDDLVDVHWCTDNGENEASNIQPC